MYSVLCCDGVAVVDMIQHKDEDCSVNGLVWRFDIRLSGNAIESSGWEYASRCEGYGFGSTLVALCT